MSKYSPSFIIFSEARMKTQGEEIRKWTKSDNPLVAKTCQEIIDASGQAGQK